MNFGGTMNVDFADEPFQKSSSQAINIKSVNLAGGFTAAMQNNASHLAADSATFNFANGNAISEANLDGNVNFSSTCGSLKTQKAKLLFAEDNAISQADLDGNVNFNSNSGSGSSQKAKVLFDKGNAISEADLNGNVNFDSGTGSLKSEKAKCFHQRQQRQCLCLKRPELGNVEIVPAKDKGRSPQGVFRAQRIDYDVPKGYAVAEGRSNLLFQ